MEVGGLYKRHSHPGEIWRISRLIDIGNFSSKDEPMFAVTFQRTESHLPPYHFTGYITMVYFQSKFDKHFTVFHVDEV